VVPAYSAVLTDTIVAVSTAAGMSLRSIVRMSGPRALELLGRLMAGRIAECGLPHDNYFAFQANILLDDIRLPARVYVMRAPASYTREDVVELHLFGNRALQGALLSGLTSSGARPAEPGEFTRRAFLNGRLDLAQAEAVQQLIRARNESEYRAASAVLVGRLSRRIHNLRERLAELAAAVEAALDFSDQDIEIISHHEVVRRLSPMRDEVRALLETRDHGRLPCQAIRAVLFGPPNAGKSSLFNVILRCRRAIVSPHPGTTRDTIEASAALNDMELLLVDTAGLRPPKDEVEIAAVSRSHESIRRADLGLCVLDCRASPGPETHEALQAVAPDRALILLNKCDLGPCHPQLEQSLPRGVETIAVSAREGTGIPRVLQRITARVEQGQVDRGPGEVMVNARQAGLLRLAFAAMTRALEGEDGPPLMDLTAGDIREALDALSALTGGTDLAGSGTAVVTEDILDRIFSTFCLGK